MSEYLVLPFGVVDFVHAVSHLFKTPGAKPLGRVIAVFGAKGGVGSSTIAHNIAWHFATELQTDTIIADLDLGFGTAGLDFNQDPPTGIAEAVFAPDRVDATLVDRLLSKCGDNLHLLAAPAMLDRLYDFGETSFDSLIDAVRALDPWIVLDIPHGWTAWTRRMLVAADEVIVVAQPDLANLRNAKNIIDNIRNARPHDHPPRLIFNNVGMFRSDRKFRSPTSARRSRWNQPPSSRTIRQIVRLGRQQRPDDRRDRAQGQECGDCSATWRISSPAGRDVKKQKRGLFDPFFSKLSKKA